MRPDKHEWAMKIACVVATRSTCIRRNVGCVLVDNQGRILSTGYNGVARGVQHCNAPIAVMDIWQNIKITHPHACAAATATSGTNLEGCGAIHAEMNALLQCRNVDAIDICYSTTEPCAHCTKLLLNTGCSTVIYTEDYPQGGGKAHWVLGRPDKQWSKLLISLP